MNCSRIRDLHSRRRCASAEGVFSTPAPVQFKEEESATSSMADLDDLSMAFSMQLPGCSNTTVNKVPLAERCVSQSALGWVRCCDGDRSCVDACAEKSPLSRSQASAVCARLGRTLCTATALRKGVCCLPPACGLNVKLVWSRDDCSWDECVRSRGVEMCRLRDYRYYDDHMTLDHAHQRAMCDVPHKSYALRAASTSTKDHSCLSGQDGGAGRWVRGSRSLHNSEPNVPGCFGVDDFEWEITGACALEALNLQSFCRKLAGFSLKTSRMEGGRSPSAARQRGAGWV